MTLSPAKLINAIATIRTVWRGRALREPLLQMAPETARSSAQKISPQVSASSSPTSASDTLQKGVEFQGGAAPEIQCMRLQKDLRGPSPLIVQQGKEFPFRVELGGGAELGQHLARDAVDAHAGPLRALAVARIGDLPKHGDHAQLLQQDGVEGHLVQTVENLGRRARGPFTLDRVDLNKNGILRFAFPNERRDRGITGITSVPVGLAVDLYGLEHGGQTSRGEQNVRRNSIVLEHVTAAGPNIGSGDEELYRCSRQPLEIDCFGKNCTQWIFSHRIQVIGRQQARHEIHDDVERRRVQRPAAEKHIERPAPERAEASRLGDAAPEILQGRAGAGGPAFRVAIDQHRGIHRAGRRARNAVDSEPGLLEQTIEHAPGECPVRASALQREIDKDEIARDSGLIWFNGHWTLADIIWETLY